MTCQGIDRDEVVERYLRSELDSIAQEEFEIHILECSACLQRLEVLQATSQDLQERATEIRVTQDKRMPWWKWAPALAAALVVVAVVGTFKIKHPAPTKQTASTNSQPAGLMKPSYPQQNVGVEKDASQPGASTDSKPADNQKLATLPSGDHSVVAGSHADQPKEGEPKDSDSASPGLKAANQATQQGEQTPVQPAPSDGAATQAPPGSITAGIGSQLPLAPGEGPKSNNDETAKELFRLGRVQAPPYTFSGLAASTKIVKLGNKQPGKKREEDDGFGAVMPTGQPGDTPPPAPGRIDFQNAMGAYVEKRYADAVPLLEADLDLEPKALDANYYLGICLLLLAQPADAIAPLKTVAESNTSALAQTAHFYLAKAYIQVEDLDNAETELRAAGAGSGRLAAEARAILSKLQAFKTKK